MAEFVEHDAREKDQRKEQEGEIQPAGGQEEDRDNLPVQATLEKKQRDQGGEQPEQAGQARG